MSPGDVLRLLLLFAGLYILLYVLSSALGGPGLLLSLLSLLRMEIVGNAAVCGNIAWYPVPECTGIFGISLWLALSLHFKFPRKVLLLGAFVSFAVDILRVLLSVALGCLLQSTLPHALLWFLTPGTVLILWRHYYPA